MVRYAIDGRHRSESLRTRVEAERYRGSLLQAVHAGDRFDVASGEPESWQPALRDVGVHDWARRWLGEQWSEWQPRTRSIIGWSLLGTVKGLHDRERELKASMSLTLERLAWLTDRT